MKYASPDTKDLIRKIQNDARDSPYLSLDLKEFILLEFKHYNLSELPEIIENTIRFFQKGDYDYEANLFSLCGKDRESI